MWRPKIFPFQLKLQMREWMSFRPTIVVSSNQINVLNVHSLNQQHTRVKCALTKLNVLCSQLLQAKMAFIWGLNIVSQNVPYKTNYTEPKLVIMVSFFSEDTSSTDTIYCIHILWEVFHFIFYWATLYRPIRLYLFFFSYKRAEGDAHMSTCFG